MAFNRYSGSQRKTHHSLDDSADDGKKVANAISALDKYIKEFTDGKRTRNIPENRANELHPSSFPYCALWHAHDIFENGGIPTTQEEDYYGQYYTGLGSFKHELMQDWLGKGGKILGNWKCKKYHDKKKPCKGKRKFDFYKPCPRCKGEMNYEELAVKYGRHTHGHLDGIFEYKGKYYIIDYKTAGQYKLFQHKSGRQKVFPLAYNKAQIESYCAYVEKQYNIKIDGWILIYVSRDKSFRDYVSVGDDYTKKDRKRMEALIKDYDKKFDIAIKAKTYENIIPLIEDKPCSCRSDYLDKFHNDYDPCPLAKNGTCFKPDKLESTMKKLAKNMKSKKEKKQ